MRRFSKGLWKSMPLSIAASVAFGAVCGAAAALLLSAAVLLFLDNWKLVGVFSAAVLAVSGYSASYLCGKFRRRHGLAIGAVCAVCLHLLLSGIGMAAFGKCSGISQMLILSVSGGIGGVLGVNSKRPKKLY